MKDSAKTRVRIESAAAEIAAIRGVGDLTVGRVASAAGVSAALVHYHFDTKQRLIVAGANRLSAGRVARRGLALGALTGLATLDLVWRAVEEEVRSGVERAWLELVVLAGRDRDVRAVVTAARAAERAALARHLPVLLDALGSAAPAAADDLAGTVAAALDGAAQSLLAGDDPALVRTAYDAFWLILVSARPLRARR